MQITVNSDQAWLIGQAMRYDREHITVALPGTLSYDMVLRNVNEVIDIVDRAIESQAAYVAALRAMPYAEYLLTYYWQHVRSLALQRDGYRCVLCASSERLQVHHNTYEHRGEEEDHLWDLATLCGKCHAKFHGVAR